MFNEYRFICKKLGNRRVLLTYKNDTYVYGDMADELYETAGVSLWWDEESAQPMTVLDPAQAEQIAEDRDCYLVEVTDMPPKWVGAFQRAMFRQQQQELQSKISYRPDRK